MIGDLMRGPLCARLMLLTVVSRLEESSLDEV